MKRIAVVFLLSVECFAAAKVPITHELMWAFKRVGAPAPSPDGKWVVFPLVEPAYDEKDQVSDLWIVATDGATPQPRRLTSTKGSESGPAWSPDSRRVAFSAKRDGDDAAQIYVIDIAAGGEAQRITNVSTGATSPRWRPDGRAILFQSSVYPGAVDDDANKKIAAERKARKYNARVYTGFPIRQWDRWLDDMQTHVLVQDVTPGARARDLLASSRMVKEAGFFGAPALTGDDLQALWAPDGQSIVFTATTNRNRAAYADVGTHLYQVALSGGEPKALTTGDTMSYSRPLFAPDGNTLYATTQALGKNTYYLDRVARLTWSGGTASGVPTILTEKWDRSVDSFAVGPDSQNLYMLGEEAGHVKLYQMPLGVAGAEVRQAIPTNLGSYTNLTIAAKAASTILVANWESSISPPEVVRIDPPQPRSRLLTRFNVDQANNIDWDNPKEFGFNGSRGQRVHNLVVLPPAFDPAKKYPLVSLIHGGANNMWRDAFVIRWNYHLLASPGYVILLTNYTGSTGFGEKFAQNIEGDPLKGPGEELNQAVDEAIKQFSYIDPTRLAAGGASYGGHLANWLQATTSRYKCLFSHAGLINLESQWGTSDTIYSREINNGGPIWEQGRIWREQNPIRLAKNFKTPMLLTIGERDFRVPLNQTLENWSYLQRLRVPSKLVVFPDANHWILKGEDHRFFFQELLGWLNQHLK